MTIACTVFSQTADYDAVRNALSAASGGASMEGGFGHQDRVSVRVPTGVLRVAFVEPAEPMDQFARMILGMFNWMTKHQASESILGFVASCRFAVGLVLEAAAGADLELARIAGAIAESLSGVVFDGHQLRDSSGKMILG